MGLTDNFDSTREREFVDKKTFLAVVGRLETKIESLSTPRRNEAKIKSLRDLKNELTAFVTIGGYSKLLGTGSLCQKVFWLVCMLPLFVYCMILVDENLKEYQEWSVVSQIVVREEDYITFPAITFCIQEQNTDTPGEEVCTQVNLTTDVFVSCDFKRVGGSNCSLDDFFNVKLLPGSMDGDPIYNCYQFNTGIDANGDERKLYKTGAFGANSGLTVRLNLSQTEYLLYFVGDNRVRPTYNELINIAQLTSKQGKLFYVDIEKTIDTKLPYPYSDCTEDITIETSDLVKELVEQNITYRKSNCYELCRLKYVQYAQLHRNESMPDFKYKQNCSDLSPLECESKTFRVKSNDLVFQRSREALLRMNFFYSSNKHTELTQTVKTTTNDVISNIGGVLELFIELSFLSVYRFISAYYTVFFP